MHDREPVSASRWPVGIAAFFALLLLAYCQGVQRGDRSSAIIQAKAAVHVADTVRFVASETVTVRLRAQARVDTLVRVLSDTQLVFRRDTLTVPPVVIERIVTDDRTIVALRTLIVADSAAIHSRDVLLALPKPRSHFGLGIGGGYSCNQKGCGPGLTVGIVWRW